MSYGNNVNNIGIWGKFIDALDYRGEIIQD